MSAFGSQILLTKMIEYDGKKYRPVLNTENGETSAEIIFHYKQEGNILFSEYKGGKIFYGHLVGLVSDDGKIELRYHQVNTDHEMMTGVCHFTPEIMLNEKIRLHETWQWTSGDKSKGSSIIEEI